MNKHQTVSIPQPNRPLLWQPLHPFLVSYRQLVGLLILALFVVRLLLASVFPLGTDESYYWYYTQNLQWNYFDHPPMVALLGRLFTANLALQHSEVFVRMGSILSCAAATWFLFRATTLLYSERAGWYAAVLYNTSFYAGIVAGLLIMPDSPQMVFWTFSMWMIARIMKNERNWSNWILLGIGAGLCIMSKVHGVFIWLGLGLYVLVQRRQWLALPQLYVAAILTALVASPILVWNVQHNFATYRFHSQRVVISGWGVQYRKFITEILGQILFNNPVNVALTAWALTRGRKLLQRQMANLSVFLYMGLPLIFILLFVSLFRTVFPHWSGPAYVSLLPVAAIYLDRLKKSALYPGWLRWSFGAFALFVVGWPLLVHTYPGTWGNRSTPALGRGDVSLDRFGWEEGGAAFGRFYRSEVARKSVAPNTPLVCNTWWGAHVEYYFGRPQQLTMIGLGSMPQVHQYLWTNAIRKERVNFSNAFCIVPSDEWYNAEKQYSKYYENIKLVKIITTVRGGLKARHFYVYRLSRWKGLLPVVR